VASAPFSAILFPHPIVLFSGLTLPPGTYYLTVQAPPSSMVVWIFGPSPLSISLGHGVTFNGELFAVASDVNQSFPPASVFQFFTNTDPNPDFSHIVGR